MADERDLTQAEIEHRRTDAEEREARRRAIINRPRFEGLQIAPDIDFYPEVADREPGDRNVVRWGFDLHPQVSLWSAGIVLALLAITASLGVCAASQRPMATCISSMLFSLWNRFMIFWKG